jgi:hypothetical protein
MGFNSAFKVLKRIAEINFGNEITVKINDKWDNTINHGVSDRATLYLPLSYNIIDTKECLP